MPFFRHILLGSRAPMQLKTGPLLALLRAHSWHSNCVLNIRYSMYSTGYALLGELTDIPTDALIDLLFVILAGELTLTANDAAEIEEIQRELQRRGEGYYWTSQTVN